MEERNVPNRIDRLEQIYREQLTQVFSAESVVPDTMPDVSGVLFADAQVCIRSGALSEGAAILEGSVVGTVVYLPEGEAAPQKLSIDIPVLMSFKNEKIGTDCRLVFSAESAGAEARAMNSRKVSLRAEVCADVTVYRESCIDLTADAGELTALEILPGDASFGFVRDIGEKTFTVADDVDLSSPIGQLLWFQTHPFAENCKRAGGKTILQGGIELQLMYLTPDSDAPCFETFRIPFSQLMDAAEDDASAAGVSLHTVSCFAEILPGLGRADSVSLEMQLAAQILYTGEQKLSFISDAYSLRRPLIITRDKLEATCPFGTDARKVSVKELIKTPEQASEILCVQLCATPCVFTQEGIKTTACVRILYRTESALRSVSKKIPVTFDAELYEEEYLYCKAICSEGFSSLQGEGIQLQFDVELTSSHAAKQRLEYVSHMELDTEGQYSSQDCPSVMAVRPGDRSLWELAKTYHSTVTLIESANADCAESDCFLLIPRGR